MMPDVNTVERIELRNIFKKYGKKVALSGISLEFEKGKVYGVLGPNGMGKTTLLKIIAGILRPTSGRVLFTGFNRNVKELISFSPENNGLYENMSVFKFLDFVSKMSSLWSKEREKMLLRILDIPLYEKIGNLSRGFKARLRVLVALSKKTGFYLLDEPFSGIDPTSRFRIKEAIQGNFLEDSSLIITSHIISEIESLFDYVYFIDEGEVVLHGEADSLRKKYDTTIEGIYISTFR